MRIAVSRFYIWQPSNGNTGTVFGEVDQVDRVDDMDNTDNTDRHGRDTDGIRCGAHNLFLRNDLPGHRYCVRGWMGV